LNLNRQPQILKQNAGTVDTVCQRPLAAATNNTNTNTNTNTTNTNTANTASTTIPLAS
jgi:hypothetical protein